MILFIGHPGNSKTYRGSERISGHPGLDLGKSWLQSNTAESGGMMEPFYILTVHVSQMQRTLYQEG